MSANTTGFTIVAKFRNVTFTDVSVTSDDTYRGLEIPRSTRKTRKNIRITNCYVTGSEYARRIGPWWKRTQLIHNGGKP